MNIQNWLKRNTASLSGKLVALTGATGGIGRELCRYILMLGGELVLIDRNPDKSARLVNDLTAAFPHASIRRITADMEDMRAVQAACERLKALPVDILIHNAGAYSIPRRTCETGLDNVFQINFASPYYITKQLLPTLAARGGRVLAVGSIAHTYSVTDPADIDFATRGRASLVYGNAKRYLMFSLFSLLREHPTVSLAVTHPGITFTNITAHYPKWIFAIIKHPMKRIFMKPATAALCVLRGLFEETAYFEWIGPALFGVWGSPRRRALKSGTPAERRRVFETAEALYGDMAEKFVKSGGECGVSS